MVKKAQQEFIHGSRAFQIVNVPYIEVYVEPGDPDLETFDPSKLTFTYTAEFIDARTIEI